jgi:hypothetical protein
MTRLCFDYAETSQTWIPFFPNILSFFLDDKTSEFMHKRLEWANKSNDDDGISHIQVVNVYRILLSLPAFQVTTETEHRKNNIVSKKKKSNESLKRH